MFAHYLALVAPSTDDGLSAAEVLESIPTDPASVFTMTLVAFVVVLILWTGKPRKKGGRPA